MIPQKKLIAFGDVNVDLVTEIPRALGTDSGRPQTGAQLLGGGTIGNTAAGTARLGIETVFLGKVGRDGYGRFLKEGFEADGVDTSFLLEDPDHFTVMVIAFIDSAGEKHNVTFPRTGGAHFQMTVKEVNPLVWDRAGWFHTSGISLGEEPCRSAALELMRQARNRGLTVSFDLNLRLEFFGWRPGVREATLTAMALSDVVFTSVDDELYPLTGKTGAHEGLSALGQQYPRGENFLSPARQTLIARRGPEPALISHRGESFWSPGYEVPVVDTLGAGDAFNAGFIAGRLTGMNLEDSLTWAHGAAGFNITQKGARGMPDKSSLLEFISTH